MLAKFEPTGTYIQHGYLEVRIDLFPDPARKTYPIHYVDKPKIPKEGYQGEKDDKGAPKNPDDYKAWIESRPTYKELNPCFCHSIKISEDTTKPQLRAIILDTFDSTTVNIVDEGLSKERGQPERKEALSLMNTTRKRGRGRNLSLVYNKKEEAKKLITKINTRFKGLEVEVGSN